jgi:23S rRNA pseudouridine1911/1915/1917 synthase
MTTIHRSAEVPENLAGRRLDQAAAVLWPEFSRSRLQGWIKEGALRLGGELAVPRTPVQAGQQVSIAVTLAPATRAVAEAIDLDVMFRDDDLLVINKPAGLVVHPGAGNSSGTLMNALLHDTPALAELPRAGIVHRLDKHTSGVLVVARSVAAHTALVAALQRREVSRHYHAIVQSIVTGGGQVDAPIGRHPRNRLKMAVVPGGRAAVTHYRIGKRFRTHTELAIQLETGRTHQIRVHMAHIGYPLLGDPVYGGRPKFPPGCSDELREQLQAFQRQALHARHLSFTHPVSGEQVEFEAPIPQDMLDVSAALAVNAKER